jgi:hypothetical protein
MVRSMKTNFAQKQMASRITRALDAAGGENLHGSGFENETPDGGFTAPSVPLAGPEHRAPGARDGFSLSIMPRKAPSPE